MTRVLISLSVICSLFACQSPSGPQSLSEFSQRLFQVFAEDDYGQFKREFFPSEAFMQLIAYDVPAEKVSEIYQTMESNVPRMYKRMAKEELFKDGQFHQIDWAQAKIGLLDSAISYRHGVAGGTLTIPFRTLDTDCTLRFRRIAQDEDGTWKLLEYGRCKCD